MNPVDGSAGRALSRLRELRDGGLLAESYPEVCALVACLDERGTAWAGRLLAALDPELIAAAHPGLPVVMVALTGSANPAPLAAPLAAEFARRRLVLRAVPLSPGQYVADLGDSKSPVYEGETNLTACVLDLRAVTAELPPLWTVEDCERVLRTAGARIRDLAVRYDGDATGVLVLNTVPLPDWFARRLVDYRSRALLGAAWREFNGALLRLAADLRRVVVIDLDTRLAGPVAMDEPRLRAYTDVAFGEALTACLAQELAGVAGALNGRAKKGLVLDLDGTLWGGVLGEDGPEGIEIGGEGRGAAFAEFQRVVAQLGSQGVLLAVCSRNDRESVAEALRRRTEMPLGDNDFSEIVANWEAKDANVAGIAGTLGLDPGALVFADDDPFERGLLREGLPEVGVVELDGEPALHSWRLLAGDWFSTIQVTGDDRSRRERYRSEARRKEFREGFSSLPEYLAELGVEVCLYQPDEGDFARIAQLTQRTNQFNLTTVRLDEAGVADRADGLWAIRVSDRFGDHGLAGALFTSSDGDSALSIDHALLSCRMLSRGVEGACLRAVLEYAVRRGKNSVRGCYRQTAKNARFADFYPRHGFEPDGPYFRHDLLRLPEPVSHVRLSMPGERGGVC